jgi:Na+-transporting NADH:ubiquinone oxidoreductase subunit NqrA
LLLQYSLKLKAFFGSKFFDRKRSAAGDTKSKAISFENYEKIMCLVIDKILKTMIVAFLDGPLSN